MSSIGKALRLAKGGPTEAQKEAGNYRKFHTRMHGLDIAIENLKGSERNGKGEDGKKWSVTMPAHYGYIKRTEGADGDHVDAYIGPHSDSKKAYVVNQVDHKTGKFDEHKVMLGFKSEADARRTYEDGFSDGRGKERLGSIHHMPIEEFKEWLNNGDTTKRLTRAAGGKIPKHHDPKNGAPKEHAIYVTKGEEDIVARALGHVGKMTRHGVRSYTDPSQAYGGDLSGTQTSDNYNGSGSFEGSSRSPSVGDSYTPGETPQSSSSAGYSSHGSSGSGSSSGLGGGDSFGHGSSSDSGSSTEFKSSDTGLSPNSSFASGVSTVDKSSSRESMKDPTSGIGLPDISAARTDAAVPNQYHWQEPSGTSAYTSPATSANDVLAAASADPSVGSSTAYESFPNSGESTVYKTEPPPSNAHAMPGGLGAVGYGSSQYGGDLMQAAVSNGQMYGDFTGEPDKPAEATLTPEQADDLEANMGAYRRAPSNIITADMVPSLPPGPGYSGPHSRPQPGLNAVASGSGPTLDAYNQQEPAGLASGSYASIAPYNPGGSYDVPRQALWSASNKVGIDPHDLAMAEEYETMGSMDPNKRGGKFLNGSGAGSFRGLIQFSPDNQKTYGITPGMGIADQQDAVAQYLIDRGVQPGDSFPQIYSAINAGQARYANDGRAHRDANGTLAQNIARAQQRYDQVASNYVSGSPVDTSSDTMMASNSQPNIVAADSNGDLSTQSQLIGLDPNSQQYKDLYRQIGEQNAASPAVRTAATLKKIPILKQAYQGDNFINTHDSPFYGGLVPANQQPGYQFEGAHGATSTATQSAAPVDFQSALSSARSAYASNPSDSNKYFTWTNPATGTPGTYYIGNYRSGGSVKGNNALANAIRLTRR